MNIQKFFKLMSSEVNFKLIMHLYTCESGECNVQQITQLLEQKQANISKHFIQLRKLKVVDTDKKGLEVFYSLKKSFIQKFKPFLELIAKDHCISKIVCDCSKAKISFNQDNCTHECC
ncbi:transcriptional regulator [Mycoplasmopsis ciconiae]|uniref:Transcriptional regulator n=1 Tax=Mycoplasmopsis ciconiae TaxID=561067 RepID=A0ABU7MNR4_9BACT|nr:transcriptional regulator [Mycoplasmopsis ciconiae]